VVNRNEQKRKEKPSNISCVDAWICGLLKNKTGVKWGNVNQSLRKFFLDENSKQ
jgi:hypothetical protein